MGTIGIIREVPVHPTTWFKIEFPDGSKGVTLSELASSEESISHPDIYLKIAGEKLAEQF